MKILCIIKVAFQINGERMDYLKMSLRQKIFPLDKRNLDFNFSSVQNNSRKINYLSIKIKLIKVLEENLEVIFRSN